MNMLETLREFFGFRDNTGLMVLFIFVVIMLFYFLGGLSNLRNGKKEDKKNENEKERNKYEEKKELELGRKTNESSEEFMKRIKEVRKKTESDFDEELNLLDKKRKKNIYNLVDEQLNQINLNLEKDIEAEASGKLNSVATTSLGYLTYDIKNEYGEDLYVSTSDFFEENIMKRESYKKLKKKCEELKATIEIKLKDLDSSLSQQISPFAPSRESFEIIIHYDNE